MSREEQFKAITKKMRKIIFRGKRKDNGEWVEGSLYESNDNRLYVIPKQTLWITKSDGDTMRSVYGAHDIINSSIGQFTGLTDKNGKEIYEGDKVKVSVKNKGLPIDIFGKISWSDGDLCYMILWLDGDSEPLYGWHNKELEVIGNIHNI